jgi:hypothetical protein
VNLDDFSRPEAAGTLGAILGALNAPGSTLRERAWNLLAGLGAAVYLAPYAAEKFSLASMPGRMALAFLAGLLGMNIVAKLISGARRFDWWAAISSTKSKP